MYRFRLRRRDGAKSNVRESPSCDPLRGAAAGDDDFAEPHEPQLGSSLNGVQEPSECLAAATQSKPPLRNGDGTSRSRLKRATLFASTAMRMAMPRRHTSRRSMESQPAAVDAVKDAANDDVDIPSGLSPCNGASPQSSPGVHQLERSHVDTTASDSHPLPGMVDDCDIGEVSNDHKVGDRNCIGDGDEAHVVSPSAASLPATLLADDFAKLIEESEQASPTFTEPSPFSRPLPMSPNMFRRPVHDIDVSNPVAALDCASPHRRRVSRPTATSAIAATAEDLSTRLLAECRRMDTTSPDVDKSDKSGAMEVFQSVFLAERNRGRSPNSAALEVLRSCGLRANFVDEDERIASKQTLGELVSSPLNESTHLLLLETPNTPSLSA